MFAIRIASRGQRLGVTYLMGGQYSAAQSGLTRCLSSATNAGDICQRSVTPTTTDYDILILGGGSAGCAIASKFSGDDKLKIGVVEPSEVHYYQAMFTLVGRGLKEFSQTSRPTCEVIPKQCDWLKTKVTSIQPQNNSITTAKGDKLNYKYLVLALGMQLSFDKIEGLQSALTNDPRVCSNYSPKYVEKTWKAAEAFKSGNAIFTFPETPIKCAGAPQKAMFLSEDYFTCSGKRDKAVVMYNSSIDKLFGIPKYAKQLQKQIDNRDIQLNLKTRLVKVDHKNSKAFFQTDDGIKEYEYEMLHVSPPCSPPDIVGASNLGDKTGYVDVHPKTLQHLKYENIFSLGDCSNLPTAKTAAAVSAQSGVLGNNLHCLMKDKPFCREYNGYSSCPLVITRNSCILAEFGYDGKVMETFPYDQSKPRYTSYLAKAHFMPPLYWYALVKGYWNGPNIIRRVLHLGMCEK